MRIGSLDQTDFPGARPLLHGLFALDRLVNVAEFLKPNEGANGVPTGETGYQALGVLFNAPNETVGDADVERASRSTREDVDPVAVHRLHSLFDVEYAVAWIPGTSPGMTHRDVSLQWGAR